MYEYEIKKVSDLLPYVNNSRTHSEEQTTQIASSISEFGFTNPVLIDETNNLIAGHGRLLAAKKLGIEEVPAIILSGLTKAQKKAYVIADNQLALNAGWDLDMLKLEIEGLNELDFDINLLGFDDDFLDGLLEEEPDEGLTDEDEVPDLDKINPISVRGDVWQLGHNRVMCGDSTMVDDIEKLTQGEKAQLLHADPPYGMGKEGEGVANDNIYNENLDKFQQDWWIAFRIFLVDNASAYIWGNAPDLWRWWYSLLSASERLTLRNQIVWDKRHGQGMNSGQHRQFATTVESCLFFMVGEQGFNNNADNYWQGWDYFLKYLSSEKEKAGFTIKDCKRLAGHSETSGCHWFDKSQWMMPTKETYNSWKKEANEQAFNKSYDELKKEHDELKKEFYSTRAYFDNTHETMRDVWEYSRVSGQERHEHATPKPVLMMERVMKSSLPPKGLCLEPFGGSGSTLMGAEKSGRRCYTMELQPFYVDVIINRWQNFTGKQAIHIESGKTYEELSNGG
jgi:DNA modification methylase